MSVKAEDMHQWWAQHFKVLPEDMEGAAGHVQSAGHNKSTGLLASPLVSI